MPPDPQANVLGVGVHAITLDRACAAIEAAVAHRVRGYVCLTGVHGIMEAQRDPEFRVILSRAFLVAPDGMPTVWVGRLQRHSGMQRVFGPDLMLELCRRSVQKGTTHFLFGGKPGVAQDLAANLRARVPGVRIVGWCVPPFRPLNAKERSRLEAQVRKLRPDFMWIGLSTPKQERFMAEYRDRLDCGMMIGVGAAFDFHSGRLRDAPTWIKKSGLQWAHRLCQEPSRLWKRYLVNNSAFVASITLQLTGLRHYELSASRVVEALGKPGPAKSPQISQAYRSGD